VVLAGLARCLREVRDQTLHDFPHAVFSHLAVKQTHFDRQLDIGMLRRHFLLRSLGRLIRICPLSFRLDKRSSVSRFQKVRVFSFTASLKRQVEGKPEEKVGDLIRGYLFDGHVVFLLQIEVATLFVLVFDPHLAAPVETGRTFCGRAEASLLHAKVRGSQQNLGLTHLFLVH